MRHRPSPSDEQNHRSDDLFRARLDQIIRSGHPLVRLADAMPWEGIVEQVADLLPATPEGAGRASLPVRMMVGPLYLKYAYNLSDDQVLERWLELPYMQYFTGEVYPHRHPSFPMVGCGILGIPIRGLSEGVNGLVNRAQAGGAAQAVAAV